MLTYLQPELSIVFVSVGKEWKRTSLWWHLDEIMLYTDSELELALSSPRCIVQQLSLHKGMSWRCIIIFWVSRRVNVTGLWGGQCVQNQCKNIVLESHTSETRSLAVYHMFILILTAVESQIQSKLSWTLMPYLIKFIAHPFPAGQLFLQKKMIKKGPFLAEKND